MKKGKTRQRSATTCSQRIHRRIRELFNLDETDASNQRRSDRSRTHTFAVGNSEIKKHEYFARSMVKLFLEVKRGKTNGKDTWALSLSLSLSVCVCLSLSLFLFPSPPSMFNLIPRGNEFLLAAKGCATPAPQLNKTEQGLRKERNNTAHLPPLHSPAPFLWHPRHTPP